MGGSDKIAFFMNQLKANIENINHVTYMLNEGLKIA